MQRRRTARWSLVVVLLVSLAAVGSRGARAQGVPDFYDPPVPLPPASPGALIRVEAISAPAGIKAWRILYHSRTIDDADIAVSGMIAAPDAAVPAGGFPLLTVGHGTTGIARACAPSITPLTSGGNIDIPDFFGVISPFVQAGFVVAATDYQGTGAPGMPSYLVGTVEGRNVLDAARAARALPEVSLADPTFIWGHSQGGHAAAFAAMLAPDYAPDLVIEGVVLAAPAAELSLMVGAIASITTPSDATSFFVMGAYSLSQSLPDLALNEILTPAGEATLPLVTSACDSATFAPFTRQPPSTFLRPSGATAPPWSTTIADQVPGPLPPAIPVLIVQGLMDTTVPPITTQIFAQGLCKASDTVTLKTYAGADHSGVLAASNADVVAWLNARLAGTPAPSTCSA